jgi:hypothetical protein
LHIDKTQIPRAYPANDATSCKYADRFAIVYTDLPAVKESIPLARRKIKQARSLLKKLSFFELS